jgi:hypothetical protein
MWLNLDQLLILLDKNGPRVGQHLRALTEISVGGSLLVRLSR